MQIGQDYCNLVKFNLDPTLLGGKGEKTGTYSPRDLKRKKFHTLSPEINGNQQKSLEINREIDREIIKFDQKSEA